MNVKVWDLRTGIMLVLHMWELFSYGVVVKENRKYVHIYFILYTFK